MSFKFKHLLICLVWFSTAAVAQTKKAENTLFWEVSGKGIQKPSYLFGTYHFADKGFVDTMKIVNEKLKNVDAIVGELVIDKSMATKMIPFMVMKDKTLDNLLSPEEYTLVADYLKKFPGYDLKLFNQMKPMVVQTVILQLTAPKTFTDKNPAIDQYFQDYGTAKGKKVLGLETVEDQATVLFGTDLVRQKDMLVKMVKEDEKNRKTTDQIYQSYIGQDISKLAVLMSDPGDFTKEEMDKLLKKRNIKWMELLPNMMQEQSLFIAIGAGHLVGNDGLIKGLRSKGYTVKPISTKNN